MHKLPGFAGLSSQHLGDEEDDDRAAQPTAGKQPNQRIANRGNGIQVHQHTSVSFLGANFLALGDTLMQLAYRRAWWIFKNLH